MYTGNRLVSAARTAALSAMLGTVISCGPSAYLLDIETRQPSVTGVELIGKTISVVYLDDGVPADSLFAAGMSSAFVSRLEKEYFAGDSLISMYCLDKQEGAGYQDKSRMLGLLMDTGSDVVFLFDSPSFSGGNTSAHDGGDIAGKVPFSVKLYVYDSMDKRDTVLQFSGSSIADMADLKATAISVGNASGGKFTPMWKAEEIPFFLYDSQKWYETYFHVQDYEWRKAMDIWMDMLDTGNLEKRACIEYNIAAACYLMGQYDLAREWLEMSEGHFHLPYTAGLMSRIEDKSGSQDRL